MGSKTRRWIGPLLAALTTATAPASAKVLFTGYGDFQATPQGAYKIGGPPSVLKNFGLGPETLETRGFAINSLGLFATTALSDRTRLQMDVTYRDIGNSVKTIRIQYAYLEQKAWDATFRAGKITLPFGWYNQNRFYPFQRPSITGPVFQSAILGLPIADIGASAERTFDLGAAALTADVYAVNGYGPSPGSTDTFRSASLPGALTISNNLGSVDANHKVAVGGRLDLSPRGAPESSVGASYYRGEWDPAGQRLLQMAGAHAHGQWAGVEGLAEYLHLSVQGDHGFAANLGSQDWSTDGFFVETDYHGLKPRGRELTPWARYEYTVSRGSGGGGRERLSVAAGGVALRVMDGLIAKAEFDSLSYRLPFAAGDVTLSGYTLTLGLTATF